jgi:hypothetical protein
MKEEHIQNFIQLLFNIKNVLTEEYPKLTCFEETLTNSIQLLNSRNFDGFLKEVNTYRFWGKDGIWELSVFKSAKNKEIFYKSLIELSLMLEDFPNKYNNMKKVRNFLESCFY